MKKILLHIGMPKTGSTALQECLYENRAMLEKNGLGFYVPKRIIEERDLMANASFINDIVMLGKDELEWFDEEKEAFRRYVKAYDSILLSEELIWCRSFDLKDYWSRLKAVVTELAGCDVEIRPIVYIRRQDEWAFSWWKQLLPIQNPIIGADFTEYVSYMDRRGMLDYNSWIRELESSFGKERVTICVFEKSRLINNNICCDFLNLLKIEDKDFIIKDSIINPSISLKAAYATLLINRGNIQYRNRSVRKMGSLRKAVSIFARNFPDGKEVYPISMEERERFIDSYAESNKKVAQRYFGREKLFSNEIEPYEVCVPNREEDIDNAKSIMKLARYAELSAQSLLECAD